MRRAYRLRHGQATSGEPVLHVERGHDVTRKRPDDHTRDHDARSEDRDGLAAMRLWQPCAEEIDHAGIEARFQHAEQEPRRVELVRSPYEQHGGGTHAPAGHDGAKHPARAPALEHDAGGHFEQYVGDEEQACAEAVGGVGEFEGLVQLQLSERDVEAVHRAEQVAQEQDRREAPHDLAADGVLRGTQRHDAWKGCHPGLRNRAGSARVFRPPLSYADGRLFCDSSISRRVDM
jgi:hypothetical protein